MEQIVAFVLLVSLLVASIAANPVLVQSQDSSEGSIRTVRSPRILSHLLGFGRPYRPHGGYGGYHGGHGGYHGGHGGYHGGYQDGYHGGYGGPPNHGHYGGYPGGGSFAGSAAFAGGSGHGGAGAQSQSTSFALGPLSASFSQSQSLAGGRRDPGFFDY